jgi:hypothetical protein
MFLMCLSILASWALLKTWQVYMMTVRTEDWLRISEVEHRRKMAWADRIGDRGKKVANRITGWLVR